MLKRVWPAWPYSFIDRAKRQRRFSRTTNNKSVDDDEVKLVELKNPISVEHSSIKSAINDTHRIPLIPRIVGEWKLEILSCLGALISVLALAVFLTRYEKQPKPQWPAKITLNSAVSVFAVLLKACMVMPVSECISQCKWLWYQNSHSLYDLDVFDQASRSTAGSFKLLFKLRFKTIAVIGAFLTICAVAIDPILQLCLEYNSSLLETTSSQASVPISRNYSESDASGTSLVDEALLGTFYTSIISPNSSNLRVNADCPTGQCTFKTPYESMGFCKSCANVSQWIRAQFQNATLLLLFKEDDVEGTVNYYNVAWLNATLPGGPMLYMGPSPSGHITAMNISSFRPGIGYTDVLNNAAFNVPLTPASDAPTVEMDATSTTLLPFLSIGPTLAACTSDWMDGGPSHPETDCLVLAKLRNGLDPTGITGIISTPVNASVDLGPNEPYQSTNAFPPITMWPNLTATLCTLSLCQKSFSATVDSGTLNEDILYETNIIDLNKSDSSTSIERRYVAVDCAINGEKHETTEYFDPGLFAPVNASVNFDKLADTSRDTSLLDDCTYKLSNRLFESSFYQLAMLCSGSATFTGDPNSVVSVQQKGSNLTTINPWGFAKYVDWGNTTYLASLYNEGNWSLATMDRSFQQIADALTNHLRLNDYSNHAATGKAYHVETVVLVHLWWLVLPALLVVCATAFLMLTVRSTQRHARGNITWKSSQVALLYHGLDDREELNDVVSKKAMKRHAEATAVKLGKENTGWRLVRRRRPDASAPEQEPVSASRPSLPSDDMLNVDEMGMVRKPYEAI